MKIKTAEIKMKNGGVLSPTKSSSENVVRSSRYPFESQPYHFKPLRFEKEYVFTYWYHKDTKEKINMEKIWFVKVTFPNTVKGRYSLQCETESVNDMGLSTTLYNYYVNEEIQGVPVKLYLTDIIENGGEVVVQDSTPPKYTTEIIESDVFIAQETMNFLHHISPQVDREEIDTLLNRLSYSPSVNANYDFVYEDVVVCDGTVLFIWNKQSEMFRNLMLGKVIKKEDIEKDNSNIKYQIGDGTIEIENDVETDKSFPMSKYTFKIPVKIV